MLFKFRVTVLTSVFALTCFAATDGTAATVGADGGVTLWVSYDNSDTGPLDIDATVTVDDTVGSSCGPTNTARSNNGAPDSPSQCPGGATSCTGREKVTGDIEQFAENVWQATGGATYIRRVYVTDEGRAWDTADVQWNMNTAGSSADGGGWDNVGQSIGLRSSMRSCIHDVLHHEFGHYFHRMSDKYRSSTGYYQGSIDGGPTFPVSVTVGDPSTVMNLNFPHFFSDTTNASLTVDYTEPGESAVTGQVLTPGLLTDGNPDNDGPDRAHHGHTAPFAQDEWSLLPDEHAHLSGVHTEGDFSVPGGMPAVDIVFLDGSQPLPGTVLLLDRSGSMGVQTDGVPASQYVQEAGLYLYHSALPNDFVGTYLYNASVEELFEYDAYDPNNQLAQANFRPAQGLTNIADALKTGIDALIAEHGQGGVNGAQIVLMSDGRQTTGMDLWDEVARANMLGIKINTFSFGNADTPTMEQIASDTSGGGSIEVSEREDAYELKLGMAREFSEIRGFTPVHSFKDILNKTEIVERVEEYAGSFVVPPFSRNLSFYSFLEGGNAALYDLELTTPSGNTITGQADSIAERGRFNGVKTEKPEPGQWSYRVRGTRASDFVLPRVNPFELTAYVRNLTLDAQLSLDGEGDLPGTVRVTGTVHYRYPLTDVRARVHVFRGGVRVGAVELFDDGATAGDLQRGDGVYTGLLDIAKFGLDRPTNRERVAKTRLDGQFVITPDSRPAPNAHYESGTDLEKLFADFEGNARFELPFEAWTTKTFDFTRKEDDRDGGRLDFLEPRDQFKVRPGSEGKLVVLLQGWLPNPELLQLSMGAGIDMKLADFEPLKTRLGATLTLTYAVRKDAYEGSRDLLAQQGSSRLLLPAATFVVP